MKTPRVILFATSLLAVFATGCATKSKTDVVESEAAKAILASDPEETVTVAPATGSNIPKKVKLKDVVTADGTKKSQTESVDPKAFMGNLRPGRKIERGN
jgi:ABC-type Fe3+-hydroxamate transport system substrate-binding protein